MKTIDVGGVRVTYPEIGWAFNPISVECQVLKRLSIPRDDFGATNIEAFDAVTGVYDSSTSAFFSKSFFYTAGTYKRVHYQVFPTPSGKTYGAGTFAGSTYQGGKYYTAGEADIAEWKEMDLPASSNAWRFCYYNDNQVTADQRCQGVILYDPDTLSQDIVTLHLRVYSTVTGKSVDIYRDTYRGFVSFDLQGFAKTLFDRDQFYGNDSGTDTTTLKSLRFDLSIVESGYEMEVLSDGIPTHWGAKQLGEADGYDNNAQFVIWEGYPFTYPMYIQKPYRIYTRRDSGGYDYGNTYPSAKYNVPVAVLGATDQIVIRGNDASNPDNPENVSGAAYPGIFDETFDHTFRGIDSETFFIRLRVGCAGSDRTAYLRWIDRYGFWNYFLFRVLSDNKSTTPRDTVFEERYDRTEPWDPQSLNTLYHPGAGQAIGKTGQDSLSLGASLLDEALYKYVSRITESPWVDMFLGYEDSTPKWLRVTVPATQLARNNKVLQDVTFTINLPETQIQVL